jgi:hypothetical protein
MGVRTGSPYTAAVEENTSRVTFAWRIASTSPTVPPTLRR